MSLKDGPYTSEKGDESGESRVGPVPREEEGDYILHEVGSPGGLGHACESVSTIRDEDVFHTGVENGVECGPGRDAVCGRTWVSDGGRTVPGEGFRGRATSDGEMCVRSSECRHGGFGRTPSTPTTGGEVGRCGRRLGMDPRRGSVTGHSVPDTCNESRPRRGRSDVFVSDVRTKDYVGVRPRRSGPGVVPVRDDERRHRHQSEPCGWTVLWSGVYTSPYSTCVTPPSLSLGDTDVVAGVRRREILPPSRRSLCLKEVDTLRIVSSLGG